MLKKLEKLYHQPSIPAKKAIAMPLGTICPYESS